MSAICLSEETSPDVDGPGAAAANQEQPQEHHQSRSLEEAVQNLRDVGDNSVPIILNIIGNKTRRAARDLVPFTIITDCIIKVLWVFGY